MATQGKTWISKFFAVALTSLVILTLILSGPAQGFTLNLNLNKPLIDSGEIVKFTAEIEIPSGENLPIDEITLTLDGPTPKTCIFDINANNLTSCEGITIAKDSTATTSYGYGYGYFNSAPYNFGYGYGATNGKLRYIITLDTDSFKAGTYLTNLKVKIGSSMFTQAGINLVVKEASIHNSGSGSCLTVWSCDDWGPCINGVQTRYCEPAINYCYAGDLPTTTQSCQTVENLNAPNTIHANAGSNNSQNSTNNTLEAINKLGSKITGAVVGVTDSTGSVIILFLVLCILTLLGIILVVRRNKIIAAAAVPKNFYVYA